MDPARSDLETHGERDARISRLAAVLNAGSRRFMADWGAWFSGLLLGAAAVALVWSGVATAQAADDSPLAVVKQLYAAFSKGDLGAVRSLIAPQAPWTQYGPSGKMALSGTRYGPDGAADFFTTVDRELTDVIHTPREFIADKEVVVVPGMENSTVRATGSRYLAPTLHVFRVRAGRIVEFEEYIDSGTAMEGYSLADARRGKAYFTSCAACHGNAAQGRLELFAPPLAGQVKGYLLAQLRNFHSGARGKAEDLRGYGMQGRVSALPGDLALRDVVAYLGTLPAPNQPAAKFSGKSGFKTSGASIFGRSCAQCHGEKGEGNAEIGAPAISGLPARYIAAQLRNFRKGLRGYAASDVPGQSMAAAAQRLRSEEQIATVSTWIGK